MRWNLRERFQRIFFTFPVRNAKDIEVKQEWKRSRLCKHRKELTKDFLKSIM